MLERLVKVFLLQLKVSTASIVFSQQHIQLRILIVNTVINFVC